MIYELVKKNRSYRGYDESFHFTREMMEDFVECARFCASTVNIQPLKYYLAYEPETVKLVQDVTYWAKALKNVTLPHPGKYPTAFIVICQDDTIDSNLNRFMRDVGIVAQTMLLRAVEQGLGGCMIGSFSAGKLSQNLGLSEHLHPLLVVALGKPDEKVVLTDPRPDGSVLYYRDEQDVHYVPKRPLKSELLN